TFFFKLSLQYLVSGSFSVSFHAASFPWWMVFIYSVRQSSKDCNVFPMIGGILFQRLARFYSDDWQLSQFGYRTEPGGSLNHNPLTVVELVLDDLGRPAGEGLDPLLETFILPPHL